MCDLNELHVSIHQIPSWKEFYNCIKKKKKRDYVNPSSSNGKEFEWGIGFKHFFQEPADVCAKQISRIIRPKSLKINHIKTIH